MWDKIKDYLVKAGTTIFGATLIIWALLNFGPTGFAEDMSQSFGAYVGKFLAPVFLPVGLGFWQITVALIAGISAKEVVVSSCAVLFGIVNASSAEGMQAFEQVAGRHRVHAAQRLLPDGVLPSVHSLRRHPCHHS